MNGADVGKPLPGSHVSSDIGEFIQVRNTALGWPVTLKAKSCASAVMSRREFIHSAREERGQMSRRMLALSFCQAGVFKDVRGLQLYPWGDTRGEEVNSWPAIAGDSRFFTGLCPGLI